MQLVKGIASLIATAWIAAVATYSVSAPRNLEDLMNEPNPALGGQSLNQQMAASQAKVRSEQCEQVTRQAERAWDRATSQGTVDRDSDKLDELDRLTEEYCRP